VGEARRFSAAEGQKERLAAVAQQRVVLGRQRGRGVPGPEQQHQFGQQPRVARRGAAEREFLHQVPSCSFQAMSRSTIRP
jgi:hypothetical protein